MPTVSWRRGLYDAIIFVSAFLPFVVPPLINKAILRLFGGASGVWTVAMLVFQVLLCLCRPASPPGLHSTGRKLVFGRPVLSITSRFPVSPRLS
jgi:hypothetical protein